MSCVYIFPIACLVVTLGAEETRHFNSISQVKHTLLSKFIGRYQSNGSELF